MSSWAGPSKSMLKVVEVQGAVCGGGAPVLARLGRRACGPEREMHSLLQSRHLRGMWSAREQRR